MSCLVLWKQTVHRFTEIWCGILQCIITYYQKSANNYVYQKLSKRHNQILWPLKIKYELCLINAFWFIKKKIVLVFRTQLDYQKKSLKLLSFGGIKCSRFPGICLCKFTGACLFHLVRWHIITVKPKQYFSSLE